MQNINLMNFLSNDILSKTLEGLNIMKTKGLYECNIKTRSHILDLTQRDKLKESEFLKFLKYFNDNYYYPFVGNHKDITLEFIKSRTLIRWDKDKLSENPNITMEFIESHPDSKYDYMSKFKNKWNIFKILKNPNFTIDELFEKYYGINNGSIFIGRISSNPNLTMEFIKSNPKLKWNWSHITNNKNITINDIEDNIDLPWDWRFISHKNLTLKFIKKYKDILNWAVVSANPSITLNDIEKNTDLPWEWRGILKNPNINMKFIKKHKDEFKDILNDMRWYDLSGIINLDDIENNKELPWNFDSINLNPNLTLKFYKKYENSEYLRSVFPNSAGKLDPKNIIRNKFEY